MILYFFLIGFVIIFMALELYFMVDVDKIEAKTTQHSLLVKFHKENGKHIPSYYLFYVRNKVFLLLAILALIVAIVMIMFVKTIIGPLQYMKTMSTQILDGDLSTTLTIDTNDELGQLAECMNDLTSNLQEIVTTVDVHRQSISDAIKRLEEQVTDRPKKQSITSKEETEDDNYQEEFNNIYESLSQLDEMVEYFRLYQIKKSSHAKSGKKS